MDAGATDLFDYDVVIMPFEEDGQRSLFVVLGAGHIKDYMKCNFQKPGRVFCTFFHMKH